MRSWVGANSGMLTQKDIKFYEQKEDQTTVFRVHSIPGGMLYTNFDVSFGNYIGMNIEYWICPQVYCQFQYKIISVHFDFTRSVSKVSHQEIEFLN